MGDLRRATAGGPEYRPARARARLIVARRARRRNALSGNVQGGVRTVGGAEFRFRFEFVHEKKSGRLSSFMEFRSTRRIYSGTNTMIGNSMRMASAYPA